MGGMMCNELGLANGLGWNHEEEVRETKRSKTKAGKGRGGEPNERRQLLFCFGVAAFVVLGIPRRLQRRWRSIFLRVPLPPCDCCRARLAGWLAFGRVDRREDKTSFTLTAFVVSHALFALLTWPGGPLSLVPTMKLLCSNGRDRTEPCGIQLDP